MKRIVWPLLAAVAFSGTLTGCGRSNAEDFALEIERPVAAVFSPFSDVQIAAAARTLFPTLKLQRTRPSDTEVLYTFPVEGEDPAVIRLVFETANGGKSTIVHATVNVPAIKTVVDGKPRVLSEALVELGLRKAIRAAAGGVQNGSSAQVSSQEFAGLMTMLAIATDKQAMVRAQELMKDPAQMAAAAAMLDEGLYDTYDAERDAESVDRPRGDSIEASDPNAAHEREEEARADERSREQDKQREAAEAGDAASGEDASGDTASPSSDE
jgi:hypothetical protein